VDVTRSRTPRQRWMLAAALTVTLGALMTGCGGADPEALSETTTTTPPETTTTTEAPVEAGQVLYVYRPGVGDCYDRRRVDGDSGEFITLLLDCSLPHTYQVFATFEFDDSTLPARNQTESSGTNLGEGPTALVPSGPPAWPGDDALAGAARLNCPPLFAEWVGVPYPVSELEISWIVPDQTSWDDGNRLIACTLWDPFNDRMSGDSRNIGR
jgi:hypothetical protein